MLDRLESRKAGSLPVKQAPFPFRNEGEVPTPAIRASLEQPSPELRRTLQIKVDGLPRVEPPPHARS